MAPSWKAAGDITFKDSDVTIEGKSLGIETGNNSDTTVTFDHTTANISAELTKEENVGRYAIYCEDSGKNGSLIVKNGSKLNLQANYGIVAGYRNVLISGNSTVDSTTRDMATSSATAREPSAYHGWQRLQHDRWFSR